MKTYKVTYTKRNNEIGSVLVKANDENQALKNAKNIVATGNSFTNPQETTDNYIKPRKQGFSGYN